MNSTDSSFDNVWKRIQDSVLLQRVKTWIFRPPFKQRWKQMVEFGDRITSLIHKDRNSFYCISSIRVVNRFNQSIHMDGPFIPIAKPDKVSGSVPHPEGFELFVKTNVGDKFITVEYDSTSWLPSSFSATPPFYFQVTTKKMLDLKNDVFFRTVESIGCDGGISAYPRHIVNFAQNAAPSLNDTNNISLYDDNDGRSINSNIYLEHPLANQRDTLFTPTSDEDIARHFEEYPERDPFDEVLLGNQHGN